MILRKRIQKMQKKRLIAMCNPRYLGNLNIEEFDNVYEW